MTEGPYEWPSPGRAGDTEDDARERNEHIRELIRDGSIDAAIARQVLDRQVADRDQRWVPIGPSASLDFSDPVVRNGGRVQDFAVSPDGMRVYAAGAQGGVWGSDDAGLTWVPLGGWASDPDAPTVVDPQPDWGAASASCIHVIFGASAAQDVVHVGTGEYHSHPYLSHPAPGAVRRSHGVLTATGPLPACQANPFARPWERQAFVLAGDTTFAITVDPTDPTSVICGTSRGLWHGVDVPPVPPATEKQWVPATGIPRGASSGTYDATAIAWNAPTAPGAQPRMWVAIADGDNTGLLFSDNGAAGPYTRVPLDADPDPAKVVDFGTYNIMLAASPTDPNVLFALELRYVGDDSKVRVWRIQSAAAAPSATQLTRVPPLNAVDNRVALAYAEMGDAATPTLFLGGTTCSGVSTALFKCEIPANGRLGFSNHRSPTSNSRWIGRGVHADLGEIKVITVGDQQQVWLSGDGGMYVSMHEGDRDTFMSRNDGLATLEGGYGSSHAVHDHPVIVGTQDNGSLMRVGDTVYKDIQSGDGGGQVFHPSGSNEVLSQYIRGDWDSNILKSNNSRIAKPILRRVTGAITSRQKADNKKSLFYTTGDAITQDGDVTKAHIAVGVDRVWLGSGWKDGRVDSWVTLPTGKDPYTRWSLRDIDRGDQVVSCKWADEDTLYVLRRNGSAGSLERLDRKTTGTGWDQVVLSATPARMEDRYPTADLTGPAGSQVRRFLRFLPDQVGRVSEIAVEGVDTLPPYPVYVGTTGSADLVAPIPELIGGIAVPQDGPTMLNMTEWETLYWFDPTGRWFPTGLQAATGGDAAVLAIVVDDEDPMIVYVGTTIGVMKGVRSVDGDGLSTWAWSSFALGLPERAVQDLSLFNNAPSDAAPLVGSQRLLRAVLPASGIWEIDLDQPLIPRTFVRVHERDTARGAIASLDVPRDETGYRVITDSGTSTFAWSASPDIVVQPAPGTLDEWPRSSSSFLNSRHHKWIFKTALFSLDPTFDVNLADTKGYRTALDRMRELRNSGRVGRSSVARSDWDALKSTDDGRTAATFCAPPWSTLSPTEADLMTRAHRRDPLDPQWSRVGPGDKRVYVLAHHREVAGVAGADVDVVLLHREVSLDRPSSAGDPAVDEPWGEITTPNAFKTSVVSLLGGSGSAPTGWTVAASSLDTSANVAHVPGSSARVDARTPGAAAFDLTISPDAKAVLMLAVVGSPDDPVSAGTLAGANVRDLVLNSWHVACHVFEPNASFVP